MADGIPSRDAASARASDGAALARRVQRWDEVRSALAVFLVGGAALLLGACDGSQSGRVVADAACASGFRWVGGTDDGNSLMKPGHDCIGCHAGGEGPRYTIAGTVYARPNEPADCLGVAGATVRVTAADGAVLDLVANDAGNFYTKAALAFPVRAEVLDTSGNVVSTMAAAQSYGGCNSCHTSAGANGAPGRVLLP